MTLDCRYRLQQTLPKDGVWQNEHFYRLAEMKKWAFVIYGATARDIESISYRLITRRYQLWSETQKNLFMGTRFQS